MLILATGCAMSPGMSFDERAVMVAGDTIDDPAPQGALQSITPELIRRQRAEKATDVSDDVKRLYGAPDAYRIGAGDILNIVVWDHPDLALAPAGSITTDATSGSPVSNGYNVSPDGLIQFPYVGSFKAGGLTEYEAREQLSARLSKYFNDPKMTVRIQSYRSGRVYVDGSVRTPGLQAVNDIPMTLPEAINRAGGFAADADRSMVSVSRDGNTAIVNMQQLTALGINPTKILLGNGDLVRVYSREDAKVYVMGEVTRPLALPLRNGRLSLNEALGEAGGVSTATGEPRQIYVVRSRIEAEPEIFHLDARSPAAYALAEGFELKSRDVVYVDPAALVRWNRVITLILPSAQVMNVGNSIGNN
ncbi:polysaccharide biosynthesis/export family protein [Variovorax flavidus]|uniref:polysaccharide biosynthesis/export family protein n=1 Tax=Variovorax flavidus TaxID=3053501 RepID=UPI0025754908|nr:polysaccharide biosynthesis/export family protein [Variovorax sp. J2P1-59]